MLINFIFLKRSYQEQDVAYYKQDLRDPIRTGRHFRWFCAWIMPPVSTSEIREKYG